VPLVLPALIHALHDGTQFSMSTATNNLRATGGLRTHPVFKVMTQLAALTFLFQKLVSDKLAIFASKC
jgi:hypothetical protein